MNEIKRRKVGDRKYIVLRDGVEIGTVVKTGEDGRDNYPWDWYIADGVESLRKASGSAESLRYGIENVANNAGLVEIVKTTEPARMLRLLATDEEMAAFPEESTKATDPAIARIDETRARRAAVEAARGGVVSEVTVAESYEDPELAYDVTVTAYGNGERCIRIEFGIEDTFMQAWVSDADWRKLITASEGNPS